MIVKLPKTDFELQVYNYINNRKFNNITNEGDKSILYDLCIMVKNKINEEITDIPKYVEQIRLGYLKNKNVTMNAVISNCINKLNIGISANVKNNIFGENERLIINKKGK